MNDWTGVQPEDLAGALERSEPCTAHQCKCGRAWIAPQSDLNICGDCLLNVSLDELLRLAAER